MPAVQKTLTLNITGSTSHSLEITGSDIPIPPLTDGYSDVIDFNTTDPIFNTMVIGGLKSDEGLDKFFTNSINGDLTVGGLIVCGSATLNHVQLDHENIYSGSMEIVDGLVHGQVEQAKLEIENLGALGTGSLDLIVDLGDGFQ
tara:strand:- start:156 stop:587 length:432 start_codon:yes stop_codon:yes gene_type:complete